MDRHFALPIAFAAALHAALLFAFPKAAPRTTPAPDDFRRVICDFVLPREEPTPVSAPDDSEAIAPPKGVVAPAIPRSSEPLVVDTGPRPTMDLPPVQPNVVADVVTVPTLPVGDPDGRAGGGYGGGPVLGTTLDNPPRTRFQVAPLYPFEARREGMGGEALVEFVVDEKGTVISASVVRSSHRVFEEPALRAVARWQFEPGRRHGRVVRFRMMVPLVFSLNE